MADDLRINDRLTIPSSEIEFRSSRSSGPGGQHANVTASRVEAIFDIAASRALTDFQRERLRNRFGDRVTAIAQDARSQTRNRGLARERLHQKLADALRVPKSRRATRPTKGSKERRLEQKRQRSQHKRARRRPSEGDY